MQVKKLRGQRTQWAIEIGWTLLAFVILVLVFGMLWLQVAVVKGG